jgi:putative membrane protein
MNRILRQFNWRFLLVRLLVNALALAITAAVTPKVYFVDKSVWSWLLIAAMLGILNALLKPILQFLTLQFIFVTYGLVLVLVNALLLLFLSFLFPDRFAVDSLLWALVGGLVLGLISSFLESLLGLTLPIVPEEEAALRRRLAEQARPIDWRAATRREIAPEEGVPAIEPPAPEAKAAAGAAVAGPVVAETAVSEPAAVGLSAPVAGEGPSPAAVEAEPSEAEVPVEPEAAPEPAASSADEPGEEEKEAERS